VGSEEKQARREDETLAKPSKRVEVCEGEQKEPDNGKTRDERDGARPRAGEEGQ
jgi:hypothetical protein